MTGETITDQFREAWKARGRELNALYDVIAGATEDSANGDPLEDLREIVAERDAIRKAATEVVSMANGYPQLETFYVFYQALLKLDEVLTEEES